MGSSEKKTKKEDVLPPGAVGIVISTVDPNTFIVSVPANPLHYQEFIEVPFEKEGQPITLVGQIILVVGENVKVGSMTQQGSVGVLGLGFDVTTTKDVQETQVKATARVVAFLDGNGDIAPHDPTVEYIGRPAYRASASNLRLVFSQLAMSEWAPLEVGTLLGSPEIVPVALDPTGLMRHTAVFGQSGSGKSYSFGIVLEELIIKTDARVLMIDPNSDYKNFDQTRPRSDIIAHSRREYTSDDHELFKQRWTTLRQRFLRFAPGGDPFGLTIAFSDLRRKEQAALLGLDPIHDREEYSVFRETLESLGDLYDLHDVINSFAGSPSVEKVRLLYRIKNREIDKLPLWGAPSVIEILRQHDWRFASIDVRDASPLERSLISSAVLESIYRDLTKNRRVTFLVIDEAHNLCPAIPWDNHQEAPRQIIHEIAAEGRKYGAFLILMTQNPSKLSPQALLQCENVFLMRMTSGLEVQALSAIVEDAGSRLAQMAFSLTKGQAVCIGGIVRTEASLHFDLRKTPPGGDDVSKEWARRRI